MSRSIARTISKDVESSLDDVTHALRDGARSLATTLPPIVKEATEKAVREVKAHPFVATAALTAAAAVIGLLFRTRRIAE